MKKFVMSYNHIITATNIMITIIYFIGWNLVYNGLKIFIIIQDIWNYYHIKQFVLFIFLYFKVLSLKY